MAMTTIVLLMYVVFVVLIVFGLVKLIKHFIRYGIDYYFKKLEESKKL